MATTLPSHQEQNQNGNGVKSEDSSDSQQQQRNNLIVNYLPPSLNRDSFRAMFLPYGEIEDAKLMVDNATRKSLGYGFIKYYNHESAAKAIQALNGQHLEGKTLKVSYSRPANEVAFTNLYITGFGENMTQIDLENIFSAYGNITDSKILYDRDTGASRGIGFVRFEKKSSAEAAIAALDGNTLAGSQRPLKVKFVESSEKRQHFNPMGGGGRYMTGYNQGGFGGNNFYNPNQVGYGGQMQGYGQQGFMMPQAYPVFDVSSDQQQGYGNQFGPRGGNGGGAAGAGGAAGYGNQFGQRGGMNNGQRNWGKGGGGKYGRGGIQHQYQHQMNHSNNNNSSSSSQGGAAGGFIKGPTTEYCVFVYNLAPQSDEATLNSLFQQFGAIDSVRVIRDPLGNCKGMGFVNFQRLEDAQNAISAMNGYKLGMRTLQVSFKTPKYR